MKKGVKLKKLYMLFFVLGVSLCGLGTMPFLSPASAANEEVLYYSGLNEEERALYNHLNNLLATASTGKEAIDIANPSYQNHISQSRIRECVEGDSSLFISLYSALDAFKFDKPQYFYVDFDKIDLLVFSQNAIERRYVAKLGYGSYGNIFYDFATDISEIKLKTNEIVDALAAKTYPLKTREEKLSRLNDEIIKLAKPDYSGSALTILDAAEGKANHLTYAQLYKLACDKLGIPSFIVNGTTSADIAEGGNQYFNLVEINSSWYLNDLWSYAQGEQFYLLAGIDTAYYNYQINHSLSGASKNFSLPNINFTGYYENNTSGLTVVSSARKTGDKIINDFIVSFKNKGLQARYIFAYRTFDGEWSAWGKISAEQVSEGYDSFRFNGETVTSDKIEFCVFNEEQIENNILFKSGVYDIAYNETVKPSVSYVLEESSNFGGGYKITVRFSEPLKQIEGENIDVKVLSDMPGAAENVTLLRSTFENNILVYEFSLGGGENEKAYDLNFTFKGVKGEFSNLAPKEWMLKVGGSLSSTSIQVAGEKLLRLSSPSLMKNSASFDSNIKRDDVNLQYKKVDEDGSVLKNKFPDVAFFDIEAYNISFQWNGGYVEPTKAGLLALPYMKNYNMLSQFSYKCYLVTGDEVLELKTVANLYGINVEIPKSGRLIVTTQSLDDSKNIYISQVGKGSLSESGIISIEGNKTLNITADEDNVIYSIAINGQVEFVNKAAKSLELVFDEVRDNSLIKIRFAPSHALSESSLTSVPTCPRASKPVIVSQDKNRRIIKGSQFALSVQAEAPIRGELKYQWYLNDKLLKNETKSSLSSVLTKETVGNYYVVITNDFDGQSLSVQSNLINVNERSLSSYLTILYVGLGLFAIIYLVRFYLHSYKKTKVQELSEADIEVESEENYGAENELPEKTTEESEKLNKKSKKKEKISPEIEDEVNNKDEDAGK